MKNQDQRCRIIARRLIMAFVCALQFFAVTGYAAGISQRTFTAGEVGTIVYTFPYNSVGGRVTIGDFQHGQLYLASGSSDAPVRDSWWSLTNFGSTASAVLIQSQNTSHDKPHNICFWQNFFNQAANGSGLRIWNFNTRAQVGSVGGTVNSLWDCVQAPFAYTGSHGYSTGSKIEIWNVSNPGSIAKIGEVDTGSGPGFQIGSVHALGNLLVCSATEAPGVAVYDISNPANPVLLDSRVDGTSRTYTSLVYGNRVYNAERTGIRVYDFSNPNNIVQVGSPILTGGTPRYLVFKDGRGYCATGSSSVKVFDATTLQILQTFTPDGRIMDFIYPLGNMAIVAGGGAGGTTSTNGARIMALQQSPDTTGPAVVTVNPGDTAANVALTARIGFSMSDQMDVTSLTTNTFIVRPVGTTAPLTGTYSTMMGLINFSPTAPLAPNTTYEVILTAGGVKDVVGNGIAAQFRSTFSTITTGAGTGGLTHLWRMDGNALDTVGGNNGANTGVTFVTGQVDQAGLFDGADFINVGTMDLGNAFTIASWVWIDATATNIQAIMANSGGGSATAGFRLFVNSFNTADRRVTLETGNGTTGNSATTANNAVTLGAWNHVAVTVDRTAGTAAIYVNGANVTADGSIQAGFTSLAGVHFGQFTDNGFRLRGRLDDVRTYNRRLTTAEISDLISVSHHWPLDGNFIDFAGGNDGVNTGATFTNAARVGTQAGVFDSADFVSAGTVNLGNAFSIATWVRLDPAATNIQSLLANAAGGANSNGFRLFVNTYNTSDGAVVFETADGTANNNARSLSAAVGTSAWNHVAVTVYRTAGTATIYVNGTNVTTDGTITTTFNNNALLHLAQFTNNGFRLRGRLDDVRIYNKVLSAAEVSSLLGTAPNSAPVISSLTASANPTPVNTSVTFTLNATDANNDALSYSFDFGDGSGQGAFTASRTASHTYTAPGRYSVLGRVRDFSGTVTTNLLEIIHRPLTATNAVASSQIIYDSSRNRVWNVNPDSDTVTRIDANTLVKDFEIAVGSEPRSIALRPNNAEVWVTCESSDQIYVLSATNGSVLATLSTPRGSRPMAVLFSPNGTSAYVTYMNSGVLARWNPGTRTVSGTLNVGPTPRALAISGDSARLFVGRFISPVNPFNPSAEVGEVREVNATTFTVTRTFNLAHDTGPDTENSSRGTPNYLLQMAITPDGQRLFVPSKKDNVDRGAFRDAGTGLGHDNTVRAIISRIDLANNVEALGERDDIDNHSMIHGVTFSPRGDLAFVAFQGNNEVGVFNAYNGQTVTGVPLGTQLAPQDLVLNPAGTRLFVLNFLTRTVSAFDVSAIVNGTSSSASQLAVINAVATEKLSPPVLRGKQIFYNAADTRMSAEGYMSCASCHLDGGSDHRVWDFTDRGEGLRNTITLEGRRGMGQGNVHWTANFDEIQDFELDIRNGFAGTGFITNGTPNSSLGAPNAGRSTELDDLAAYVASLNRFQRSPFRNADGSLTTDAVAGRQLFSQRCASCHSGSEFSDSIVSTTSPVMHNVGTIKTSSGQRLGAALTGLDTPTLKGLWNTGPYLHDGSATNLVDVLTTQNAGNQHGVTSTLTATQRTQLVSYLQQIDDLEVGGATHLWPLDGNFTDVIGTNNGINNGVTFTTGRVGSSGVFDGADSVDVGVIDLGNVFTMATWLWVDTTATNIQTILCNSGGGFSAAGFRWFVNSYGTTNRALVLETGNGVSGGSVVSGAGAITFGAWNYVAAVINRAARTATMYVNGTSVATTATLASNLTVNARLNMGQFTNGQWRLHGRLDEVAIYNRALSANEITVLMNGDSAFVGGFVPMFAKASSYEQPRLNVVYGADSMSVSWAVADGYVIESSSDLGPDAQWKPVNAPVVLDGDTYRVVLPMNFERQFFRLRK